MSYKLKLDIFEGPLDLLLFLIKKDEIDVSDIPIAEITDQYMEYIEMMKLLNLDIVGDFLVMAATLMQIKSRMLLPPDPSEEESEEEDPRDELVRKLQEYKKFKEVAQELKDRESNRQDLFSRKIDENVLNEIKEDAKEVYYEVSLFDLINALSSALQRVSEDKVYSVVHEEFTVEQKIHDVLHVLLERARVSLSAIFDQSNSREEIIVTFMAVLELIRLKEVVITQKRSFSDIEVIRNKDNFTSKAQE